MSGILRLESLTKGNTLKQGDKTPLKYRLFDADGENLNIAGKSAKVKLVYPDFLTIGYEKDGLTVAQDDTVTFTIDNVIPSRIYHVEIIVDGQFLFPSRADESKFTVDKSSLGTETNIIEIVGKDILIREVKSQVDTELQPLVASLESAQQAEAQRVLAEQERVQGYQEIQKIIEDGVLNAEPKDGSVTTEKLADKSVTDNKIADGAITREKTDFLRVLSNNLFNSSDVISGYSLDSTGTIVALEGSNTSNFIPVNADADYVMTGFSRIAYYNNEYKSLGSTGLTSSGETIRRTPTGTRYIRVVVANANLFSAQVNKGTELEPFDKFRLSVDGLELSKTVEGENIENSSVPFYKTNFVMVISDNLINNNNLVDGVSLNPYDGTLDASALNNATEFIPVTVGGKYSVTGSSRVVFYTSGKQFVYRQNLTATAHTVITVPTGAAFLRLTVSDFNIGNARLNQGEQLKSYDDYRIKVDGLDMAGNMTTDDFIADEKYVVHGDLDTTYTSPTMPDLSASLNTMQTSDLIALYDELMTANPEYITKTSLRNDSIGEPIYQYRFNAPMVPYIDDGENKPKIILIAGVHGEKTAVYSQYLALREICNNWQTNPALEVLRWDVDFVVIPVVNNYGFNNGGQRTNENGVNIARNFPVGWTLGTDPTDRNYGGAEPFSEEGTKAIDTVLQAHKDAVFFSSFHNFGDIGNNYFVWVPSPTALTTRIGKTLVSKLTRKWKSEYEFFPQDGTTYLGEARSGSVPAGSEGMYSASLGIHGGVFEMGNKVFYQPNYVEHNSIVMTLGVEAFMNWLMMGLKHGVDYYNNNSRPI